MTTPVSRKAVQAFYQAYVSRDPARVAACLDEETVWTISGPVELLHFCGERRGKAAVMDLFARVLPEAYEFKGFEPEELLIDGDRSAMFGRLTARQHGTARMIRYRFAHFLRFRNEKVLTFRSILDTFDVAEQMLGRMFDLTHEAEQMPVAPIYPPRGLVGV